MAAQIQSTQVIGGTDSTGRTQTDVQMVVFGTLPEQGLDTMTEGGVEFILCASALTAQM